MRIEDLHKAQELTQALEEGISSQREILEGLKTSLEAYQEFLTEQIQATQVQREELRNV